MAPLVRLSPADLTNLAVEASDTPMHQAVLGVLDGGELLDAEGRVRIEMVRSHVGARLDRVPELRRKLHRTHPLEGRPLWVDDPDFRIENHVLLATLPAPGGEAAAIAFAETQMARLMDRARPLWELWLLDGYANGRIGILIKLHHAIADGPAMVNMLAQVFDIEPRPIEQPGARWAPAAPPTFGELLRDNAARAAAVSGSAVRKLAHPVVALRSASKKVRAIGEEIREGRGAPRTSINKPIGISRRIAAMHVPLAEVKDVAQAQRVKLNDVFLCIVAGALRRVLGARGELLPGMSLRFSMAVSRRDAHHNMTSGNLAGVMIVPVPVGIDDPRQLLEAVAAATARSKSKQLAVVATRLMVFLAQTGITRLYTRHQHLINVLTTNLPGPPVPLYFAGSRVRDPVALPPIAGNVTVSFAALSYDGGLTLSLIADRDAWPDIDVLAGAMRSSWLDLVTACQPEASSSKARVMSAVS